MKRLIIFLKSAHTHTRLPETQSTSHTFRKKIQTGKHTVTTRKVFRDTSRLFTHTPINKSTHPLTQRTNNE